MNYIICVLIGYLLGCLSPSALIAKIKHKNLRENGTQNLGATNVSLVIGKKWGVAVMLFDIAKSFFACKIAEHILDEEHIGLVVGLFAIVGHVFPFYMHFKGGKGLAPYGGLVLAYNPKVFLFMLVTCTIILVIVNHGYAMAYSASIMFCVISTIMSKDIWVFILSACAGALIMWKHAENIKKAHNSDEMKIRDYIKTLFKRKKTEDDITEENN
ncbi:MAG: glycerol-3-phosphate acyltransferase [Clostridia bacterium]|nr:glycerol-3-phosphate acyltransferase [Clostridia bacterium]